ncbi:hypothetical protein ZIOFF_008765 [Zingiber officinale]|uniref:DDE Tnp4 domain-containing protein n=1 Tax=Zingiber officinale TaxID=94328 RepID=A0A8J5IIP1_ZINOF|nr:hypothetical protein ZIOFF_008765 [Zingiber officinale]
MSSFTLVGMQTRNALASTYSAPQRSASSAALLIGDPTVFRGKAGNFVLPRANVMKLRDRLRNEEVAASIEAGQVGLRLVSKGDRLTTVAREWNIVLRQLHPRPRATTEPRDNSAPDFVRQERALDGTLIKVTPPSDQKPRYRTRKANIASNVLGVCCPNMQFIYVLPGWEGSAHDGRMLRDDMIRSNGLKVPQGCYYLVDSGYCNADGFLAPFRGQRYHLNEFHGHRPHTAEEYFNMKHSKARNMIERCFGLLKGRWKILASPSFFPIETQVRIILACCLLHNLIRKYMSFDPQELEPFEEDDMED